MMSHIQEAITTKQELQKSVCGSTVVK